MCIIVNQSGFWIWSLSVYFWRKKSYQVNVWPNQLFFVESVFLNSIIWSQFKWYFIIHLCLFFSLAHFLSSLFCFHFPVFYLTPSLCFPVTLLFLPSRNTRGIYWLYLMSLILFHTEQVAGFPVLLIRLNLKVLCNCKNLGFSLL